MPRRVADPSPEGRIAAGRSRILARVIIPTEDGCWSWPGGTVAKEKYGALNVRLGGRDAPKVMLLVHRVTYEHYIGPIPAGLELDHLCEHPPCCNPCHLEPVTHAENIRRALERGDAPCPMGHTGSFTYRNGSRFCQACRPRWR